MIATIIELVVFREDKDVRQLLTSAIEFLEEPDWRLETGGFFAGGSTQKKGTRNRPPQGELFSSC